MAEVLPIWAERLIRELHASDVRARRLVEPLTQDQLTWKPSPGAWSVGQCLQHLVRMNEVYLPPIAAALEGRRRGRTEQILPGPFSRWFIRNYIAPSERRARAPRPADPGPDVDPDVLRRFVESNDRARDLVRVAAEYDVNSIRFRNPFVPLIRFTAGTGLEIVSRHEDRHLLQAERVVAEPGFPAA